jgi:hypothetical protein
MSGLDQLYLQLLHHGLYMLRQALNEQNRDWMDAEIEMLHNIPSLIGETNMKRHEYYWRQERVHYLSVINRIDSQLAKSRVQALYEPLWRDMEPLMPPAGSP